MLGGQPASGDVVVGDGRNTAVRKLAHGQHGVDLLRQTLEPCAIAVPAGRDDDAVDLLGQELVADTVQLVGGIPRLGHDR